MTMTRVIAGRLGMIIHVNRHVIASNAKNGENKPVWTIKPNGENSTAIYARSFVALGPTTGVADKDQLSCGARVWIAVPPGTEVDLEDAMSFMEMRAL